MLIYYYKNRVTKLIMKRNVLLINLGSPKSLKIKDVKSYLNEFLSDDLVVDLPKPIQQFILRSFILPFRPKKTKVAYEKIWSKNGSPLIYNTNKIASALKNKTNWDVRFAMRYQEPSIKDKIIEYKKDKIKELIIIPLYPHNALSTTVSTKIYVQQIVNKVYPKINLSFIEPFYDNPLYIEALSDSIRPYLQDIDKLIFSYHGIPERHLKKGDISREHCLKINNCCESNLNQSKKCYKSNVLTTSKLCAKHLNLENFKWKVSFQSRVSIIDPNWLKPYTDKQFINLPKQKIKKIAVVCPSFVADCLETLEEINIRGRADFLKFGGKKFNFIPCLNDSFKFISLLENLVLDVS